MRKLKLGYHILIAIIAFITLKILSIPPVEAWSHSPPAHYCDKDGCHHLDELGGWGLKPRRTYILLYNGSNVCVKIRNELNHNISKGLKPIKVLPAAIGPHDQNPLFGSSMFLQWHPLSNIAKRNSNDPYKEPGMDIYQYWRIVRFKNDDRDYLITEASYSTGATLYTNPPTKISLWDVPPQELAHSDWSDYQSYWKYKKILEPKGSVGSNLTTNPLDRFREYPSSSSPGDDGLQFPKIAKREQSVTHVGTPMQHIGLWGLFNRMNSVVQFAQIEGRIYTLLVDTSGRDLIVAFDAARAPGDDLCYLESTISHRVVVE